MNINFRLCDTQDRYEIYHPTLNIASSGIQYEFLPDELRNKYILLLPWTLVTVLKYLRPTDHVFMLVALRSQWHGQGLW